MTHLEKMARAIAEACPPNQPVNWECAAKAALQSLLQPDQGMVEAMAKAVYCADFGNEQTWASEPECFQWALMAKTRTAYTAAINYALKGGDL